jgi:hypothetical protein
MPSLLVEKKASNKCSNTSGGRPLPVSSTVNSTPAGFQRPGGARAVPHCADPAGGRTYQWTQHCFHQIDENLLDEDGIGHYRRHAFGNMRGQLHIAAAQLDAGQLQRLAHHLAYLGQHAIGLALFHEGADALNDLPGAGPGVPSFPARTSSVRCERAVFQARQHAEL